MSRKKEPFFAFSYGSTNAKSCYAFYLADGKIHADYRDAEGNTRGFSGIDMPEDFWERLTKLADELGMFKWKAPKLFHRFVLNVDAGVLNVEALFPDGRKLIANSMNGEPTNLTEAYEAIKELFMSANEG